MERMQLERQLKASEMLAAAAPEMSKLTRKAALEETDWNVDQAFELLRQFQVVHGEQIVTWAQEREEHVKAVREEHLRKILEEEKRKVRSWVGLHAGCMA